MPIPGFTNTSWISFGRITTTLDCANPWCRLASITSVAKQQFLIINRARLLDNFGDRNILELSVPELAVRQCCLERKKYFKLRLPGSTNPVAQMPPAHRKIGRASCRERV